MNSITKPADDSNPTPGRSLPIPPKIWLLSLGIAAVIFLSGGLTLAWFFWTTAQQQNTSPAPIGKVADFSLTERSGRTITLSDLKGKSWIAGFIFTRCPGPCPTITADMAMIRQKLPPDIQLVSFTVDPDFDTPRILSGYADKFGADKDSWWFLTGDRFKVYNLVVGSFKVPTIQVIEGGEKIITHSTNLALVDKQGNIRGYYSIEEPEDLKRIQRDAVRLLKF